MGASSSDRPVSDRPVFPEGYGLPATTDGLLEWAAVEARLVAANTYWLATVRPDGRPHVVPRWGVWVDGRFFYDGAPTTLHAQNLEANPACALHLESAESEQSVIVEGRSLATSAEPGGLGARISEAFGKYHAKGYSPAPDAWAGEGGGGLRVLTPVRAMAWFTFPTDATRFTFTP
jgi:nitroimidazol reductase NimA-like FMN-containing flavoprotein (pyridoxamine 5'-phosphate oxidase superfamily)